MLTDIRRLDRSRFRVSFSHPHKHGATRLHETKDDPNHNDTPTGPMLKHYRVRPHARESARKIASLFRLCDYGRHREEAINLILERELVS
ncbi:hypothetical protein N7326_05055 [Corynebacterium sp. ES2794-CONJ1]|uniref:hypothetical protein n=1 Tax=unclassified Corynebacterium TaxID=2624378 RepID=UPI002167997E|nr:MULTISPECIES: hypothetical protein [unclassified Corynebacterium]MCS4489896.1 hypothetical protein [Corynebacterium sp. ES2775-CONJ]MCU9519242.1 hypothetical protein [Corynebacterium sp. ES2794-CONJ1]